MEDREFRPIEFQPRPGEWFNVLRINLPVPRRFFSKRTSAHLSAGLRELKLAAESLFDEQIKRIDRLRPRVEGEQDQGDQTEGSGQARQ